MRERAQRDRIDPAKSRSKTGKNENEEMTQTNKKVKVTILTSSGPIPAVMGRSVGVNV